MTIKIEKKIVDYSVVKPEDEKKPAAAAKAEAEEQKIAEIVQMHEKVERPESLHGSTYKSRRRSPSTRSTSPSTTSSSIRAPSTSCAAPSRSSSTRRTWTTSSGSWR